MMEEKGLVPKRRFEGFEGEWDENILGNIYTFKNGLNKGKEFFGIGTPIVNYTDVFYKRSLKNKDLKGRVLVDDNELKNFNVKKGDIFFTRTSETINEIGYPSVIIENPINTVFSGFLIRARSQKGTDLNDLFKSYALFTQQFRSEMIKKSSMTTRALTSGSSLSEMIFRYPMSEEEQQKIGEFFKVLDERIANQERKTAKVKALKEAYLTEMFPKEGETVPKRRFSGFEGEWGLVVIEDIADRLDNLRVPITASARMPGMTPYYGANGIQDYVEGYTHTDENVLIAEDGANDVRNYPVHYTCGEIWVNNHAHVLSGKYNVLNNLFFSYLLKTINMLPYLVGGGRAKLNADIMMNIECLIPPIEEQQKIGSFFKNLDAQIAAEQDKLQKLKQMKEAYLEEMFV